MLKQLRRIASCCGAGYLREKFEAWRCEAADRRFDRHYATETRLQRELANLDIASENKAHGVRYEPTQARPFMLLMRGLGLSGRQTFVDFGCGKGRALLLAAEYGFQKIVGVEFARELCNVAGHNIEVYRSRTACRSEFSVLHLDAAQYPIPDDQCVFYMYNPFSDEVMENVVDNICRSVAQSPRNVYVIYLNPLCRKLIEKRPECELVYERLFHRSRFVVYSVRSDSARKLPTEKTAAVRAEADDARRALRK